MDATMATASCTPSDPSKIGLGGESNKLLWKWNNYLQIHFGRPSKRTRNRHVLWIIDVVERRKEKMLWYDDSVGFGYVCDCVFWEESEPFVLGQWIEQDAFLNFAQKVDAIENVAQEIVHLNTHGHVEIVQVGWSQHLLRITDLNAQCRQLFVHKMAGRCRERQIMMWKKPSGRDDME